MNDRYTLNFIDRADIPAGHPVMQFMQIWESLKTGDGFPDWATFKPMQYPRILPWMILIERERRNAQDVHRIRLQGSSCELLLGRSFPGDYMEDEMPARAVTERLREFDKLGRSDGFLLSHTHIPVEGRQYQSIYRGAFAFGFKGTAFSRIVVVMAPEKTKLG